MQTLAGRVALITGAGRAGSIGAAVARRLAQDGADIVVADLCAPPTDLPHAGNARWEELEAVAAGVRSWGCAACRCASTSATRRRCRP